MPNCCICYTTDQNYLFATLASAIETKRYLHGATDIFIFAFDVDPVAQSDFKSVCEKENIHLQFLDNAIIENGPVATSRLFLSRFVPKQYTHFLYLDGDVQVVNSLDELLTEDVPSGHFFAANDPLTFLLADSDGQSRELAAHVAAVGVNSDQAKSYFNSGVLLINRTGWDKIGEEAWGLYRKNAKTFRFFDQDALNVVAANKRMHFSLKWNFPIFMRNFRIDFEIKPHIYHFMSSPKPWHGHFPPWDAAACLPYSRLIKRYPALAPYSKPMPLTRQLRYHLQQRYKRIYEMFAWGLSERKKRILFYEEEVVALLAEYRKSAAALASAQ